MRTVKALKLAGFDIQPSTNGIGCTDIRSNQPFWYYNPRFCSSMSEIHEGTRAATEHNGVHQMTLAGSYADDDEFPFIIIEPQRKALLDDARGRFVTACNEQARAADDYMDALRTDEPYFG